MFNVGPAELLILVVVFLLPVGIPVWGLLDAASRPDWAWERVDQNKVRWIFLQALGVAPFLIIGFVCSVFYLAAIRPKLRSAQAST